MLFLSWRQMVARKKQTILILLGISFGTLLFVSISGVQLGMRHYIAQQLLNHTAHILISGSERSITPQEVRDAFYGPSEAVKWFFPPSGLREEVNLENYGGWYDLLSRDPRVVDFSPRMSTHVILSKGRFHSSVNLIGTIPEKTVRITSIESYMKDGSFMALKGSHHIVIGSGVADDMGVKIGQYLNLNTGNGKLTSFKIVGIFHFGNEQVDKTLSFVNLSDIQILTRSPGRVSEIAVALFDIDKSKEIADEWKILTKDKVEDWQEANQSFMEMIKVQDISRYFITTAILVVASFGIYNVLSIMINQKKKEIAILRAIGYGPDKILQLILFQGLILGFLGAILGLVLGHLLNLYIGSIDLNIEIGGGHHLWISYDWKIYVTAFLSAMFSSLISSLIPARAASKMTPMDILRSE
jgi:lipoprotein-releasing system permease protein